MTTKGNFLILALSDTIELLLLNKAAKGRENIHLKLGKENKNESDENFSFYFFFFFFFAHAKVKVFHLALNEITNSMKIKQMNLSISPKFAMLGDEEKERKKEVKQQQNCSA